MDAAARPCCSRVTQQPQIPPARLRPRTTLSKQRWPKPIRALRFRSRFLLRHLCSCRNALEVFGATGLIRNEADQRQIFTTEDTGFTGEFLNVFPTSEILS